MSIPNGTTRDRFIIDAPSLGWAGTNGSNFTQSTFKGGPVTILLELSQDTPDIAPSDFTLASTGTAQGQVTSVARHRSSDPYGIGGYAVTIDNISGDGSLTLSFTEAPAVAGGASPPPTLVDTIAIQTTPPRLVRTEALTPAGPYGAGAGLTFAVHFNERVRPSDIPPVLTLSDGASATYAGGSGTSTLLFTHAVTPGEVGTDVTPTGFAANGAQILDVAGNAADLSNLNATATGLVIDGGPPDAPTVSSIIAHTSSGSRAVAAGDTITYTVATTSPVQVLFTPGEVPPSLVLSDGTRAVYTGQDPDGSLLFTRAIAPNDVPGSLSVVGLEPGDAHIVTPPDVRFSDPEVVPTAGGATSVVVADVNGDGIADLITADARSPVVSVALGTGGGAFAAPTRYAVAAPAVGLTVADVNHDGTPDIVAARSGIASVLLGTGDGSFHQPIDLSLPFTSFFNVSAVDLRGDGQPEIVFDGVRAIQKQGTSGSSLDDFYSYTALDVFRWNAQTGTFEEDPSFTSAPVAGGHDAALVDMNRDGRLDVVGATYYADLPFAYQPPTAFTFNDPITGATVQGSVGGSSESPSAISIATAIDEFANFAGVLDGRSPWSFNGGSIYQSYDTQTVLSVVTTAFLSDQEVPDVVSAGQDMLSVLAVGTKTYRSCLYRTKIDIPVDVVAADINGDGRPDVMVGGFGTDTDGNLTPMVSVFLNYGDAGGRLVSAGTFDVNGMGALPVTGKKGNGFTLADVDGDGSPDLVEALPGGGVAIRLNQSTPSRSLVTSSLDMALLAPGAITVATPSVPTPTDGTTITVPPTPTPDGGPAVTPQTVPVTASPSSPGAVPQPAASPGDGNNPLAGTTQRRDIAGHRYTTMDVSHDAEGRVAARTLYGPGGRVYRHSTTAFEQDGSSATTTEGGIVFARRPFHAYVDRFAPDGTAIEEDVFYKDGHQTIQGLVPGATLRSLYDDTFSTQPGGHNTFVFTPSFDHDTITNFVVGGPNHDTISLPPSASGHLGAILAHATTDLQGSAVLRLGQGDTITINGVSIGDLRHHRGDFAFQP